MPVQDLLKKELIKKVEIYEKAEKLWLSMLFQLELENYNLKKELLEIRKQYATGLESGLRYDGRIYIDGKHYWLDKNLNWWIFGRKGTKFLGKMVFEKVKISDKDKIVVAEAINKERWG